MFILLACCLIVIVKATSIDSTPPIVSIILIIFLIILIILIGFLFMLHIYLIATGQSTNEYSKRKKISILNQGVFRNFLKVFCASNPPAYRTYKKPKIDYLNTRNTNEFASTTILNETNKKPSIDVSHIPIKTLENFSNTYAQKIHENNINVNNGYFYTIAKQAPIGIENLYIEEPLKSKLSIKKALNLASKTANVSSF